MRDSNPEPAKFKLYTVTISYTARGTRQYRLGAHSRLEAREKALLEIAKENDISHYIIESIEN